MTVPERTLTSRPEDFRPGEHARPTELPALIVALRFAVIDLATLSARAQELCDEIDAALAPIAERVEAAHAHERRRNGR